MTREPFPNDTPGPVTGGCGHEGCGHDADDHYVIRAGMAAPGYPVPIAARAMVGTGPCNVRGRWTHCICYAYAVNVKARLEYLRSQIEAESIRYSELSELQGLAQHIDPSDVVLLEWAGVPEFPESTIEL